ncbi:MAG: hypothetical protein FJX56_07220 [Alphaproteobacteria bacterium]|nr:hypothetical protein [Alphaproteobacteria bacterium]
MTAAAVSGLLLAAGCGTPQEVKELSTLQVKALGQSLAALRVQSEALVVLAEHAAASAEATIAAERSRLDERAVQAIAEEAGRADAVATILARRLAAEASFAAEQASVARNLAIIRAETAELVVFQEQAISLDAAALAQAAARARDALAEAQARREALAMSLALVRQALAIVL